VPRHIAPRQWPVTEYIAQAPTESIAYLGDAFVRHPGGSVSVTAVFDERYFGVGRTQYMVVCFVDGPVKPVGRGFGCHVEDRTLRPLQLNVCPLVFV
jgi:hypothetical protein